MKPNLLLPMLAVVLTLAGCASILSKSQYPVTFSSVPHGATVIVRNQKGLEVHRAQTPATVTLNASAGFFAKEKYTIEMQKEGYRTASMPLNAMIDPWYFGNIIFGGLIGLFIVDPLTGAMWELDNTLVAGLDPLQNTLDVTPPMQAPAVNGSVVDQLRQLKSLRDEGVISAEEYELKRAPLLERL